MKSSEVRTIKTAHLTCGHVVFCSKDQTNVNSLLFMQHNTEVREFHNESDGPGGMGDGVGCKTYNRRPNG